MVQQPCKECVEARRLQDEEAVQLLAVQLVEGDGVARVEHGHRAEGGQVQVEAEHAVTAGEEAAKRGSALERFWRKYSRSNGKGGTWPVGCGRAYWPSGTAGTPRV